jgi:hypothetical protein
MSTPIVTVFSKKISLAPFSVLSFYREKTRTLIDKRNNLRLVHKVTKSSSDRLDATNSSVKKRINAIERRRKKLQCRHDMLTQKMDREMLAWNARLYTNMWLTYQLRPKQNDRITRNAKKFVKFLEKRGELGTSTTDNWRRVMGFQESDDENESGEGDEDEDDGEEQDDEDAKDI